MDDTANVSPEDTATEQLPCRCEDCMDRLEGRESDEWRRYAVDLGLVPDRGGTPFVLAA